MAETRFGNFEELIEGQANEVQELAVALKDLIYSADPDSIEVVRLGDRAACYGVGPKKMSEAYCYIMPQKDRINFGFFRGSALEDPEALLEGTGANMRHVKIRTVEDVSAPALVALLKASIQERIRGLKEQNGDG